MKKATTKDGSQPAKKAAAKAGTQPAKKAAAKGGSQPAKKVTAKDSEQPAKKSTAKGGTQSPMERPFPYMANFLPTVDTMLKYISSTLDDNTTTVDKYKFDGKKSPVVKGSLVRYYLGDAVANHFTEDVRIRCSRNNRINPWTEWNRHGHQLDDQIYKSKPIAELTLNESQALQYKYRELVYAYSTECNNFNTSLGVLIIKLLGSTKVLDPSAGWGDRALASIASGVSTYDGYDPNTNLQEGYGKIQKLAKSHGLKYTFTMSPFDLVDTSTLEAKYDLVLTSPPYFDLEIYSSDKSQSVVRFRDYGEWVDGFLTPYVTKAWSLLVVGGNLAIYVEDVRNCKLTKDVKDIVTPLNSKFRGVIGYQFGDGAIRPAFIWQKTK
jgi:hypothetical protein